MTQQNEITDFYDVEVAPSEGLPTGTKNKGLFYHLAVTEATPDKWEDSRDRLDIRTEVVSGEYAGKYGPRNTYSLGGYEGARNGRPFVITAAQQADTLLKFVRAAHPERISFSRPVGKQAGEYIGLDEVALADIAAAIVGSEFIAKVRNDKNGYMRWSDVHAMSDPPDGFEVEAGSQPFQL